MYKEGGKMRGRGRTNKAEAPDDMYNDWKSDDSIFLFFLRAKAFNGSPSRG